MKATPPPPPPEPTPPAETQPAAAPASPPAAETPAPPPDAPATWPAWFRAADAVIALLVLIPAFLVASTAARNSDLWPHLAAGRLLAEGKYQLGTDPFSYATAGRTWVNHSWLLDLVAYKLYAASPTGAALVAVKAMVVAVAFGLLFLLRRPGYALLPWAVFAGVGVLASAPQVGLRPHTVSLLGLALTLVVLFRLEWRPGSWRNPLLLAGLFAVWGNVDAWFVLGPLAVGVVLLGEWLNKAVLGEKADDATPGPFAPPARLPDLAKALAVGLVGCMVNPHHVGVWQLPPELRVGLPPGLEADAHFRGATLSPLAEIYYNQPGLGYNLNGLAYLVLFVAGGASLAGGFNRLRLSHLLLWLAFAYLSTRHIRLIPFFAVAAVPLAAASLNAVSERIRLGPTTRRGTRAALALSGVARLVALPAAVLLAAAAWPGWLQPKPGDPAYVNRAAWAVEPDPGFSRTAKLLQSWRDAGKLPSDYRGLVFNVELANYMAWFAPGEKVLANARYTFHAPELPDVLAGRKATRSRFRPDDPPLDTDAVREIAEKHKAAYLVLAGDGNGSVNLEPILVLTQNTRDWMLWHVDGRAAVLGAASARMSDPAAFDALTFDPVRLAFAPDRSPVPEAPPAAPPPVETEWWEEFDQPPPKPPAIEALDARVWMLLGLQTANIQAKRDRFQIETAQAAAAAVVGIAGTTVASRPLPPPGDAPLALTLLAAQAARTAVAKNPDRADPYVTLKDLYSRPLFDLYPTPLLSFLIANPAELRMQRVVALRMALDRTPPPDQVPPDRAEEAWRMAAELGQLYVSPPLVMLDMARDEFARSKAYGERFGRTRSREEQAEIAGQTDQMTRRVEDAFTKSNNEFELQLRTNPKPAKQIEMLIQFGLVGRAVQQFKAGKPEDYGPERDRLAITLVQYLLAAGMVVEAAAALDDPAGGAQAREAGAQLRPLRENLWRITGQYSKLAEDMKTYPSLPLSPEDKKLVAAAMAGGTGWQTVSGGLHGAAGGSAGVLVNNDLTARGFAPVVLRAWLDEVRFYTDAGILAAQAGDNRTARVRFGQALAPQGIPIPPFRPDRAMIERYVRMLDAAAK